MSLIRTLIESQVPFRLQEGDLLTFGNTELKVSIVEAGTTNANPVNENAPPPLPTA